MPLALIFCWFLAHGEAEQVAKPAELGQLDWWQVSKDRTMLSDDFERLEQKH